MSLKVQEGRRRRQRGPYIILHVFMVEKKILSFRVQYVSKRNN